MLPSTDRVKSFARVVVPDRHVIAACVVAACAHIALLSIQVQAADDPWYEALSAAEKRIKEFEQAVDTGDSIAMQRAALDLQADPIAVKRFNQASTDAYRSAHNNVTDGIKAKTRQLMRETIARERGVPVESVTTFEATNPPKPGDPIKVGQDWDVTVRVDGVDVDHTMSGQHVNDAFYEAVNGKKPPSAQAANSLAHRQAIEVTSYQHPEAYGGAQSEGGKIISDPGGSPTLRDPEQLGNTIDFKSRLPGNEAARLEAAGKFVEAQGFRMEQARQAAKQFDRQVAVRVGAMGGAVPPHVKKAMDIMRDIGDGKITPTQGKRLLAAMGESIDSVASKSAGLIEAAQTVRPKGLGAADDVFVNNAKNRLRSKGIDPDGLSSRSLDPNLDMADFRKGAATNARTWAGVAMETLEVVGWAADFYEISQAVKKYLQMFDKAMDPNISDEEAAKYFEKMNEAANEVTLLGGMAALFEAYPPAAGVFGVYTISRLGLENTETGQAIDKAGFVIADTTIQVAEKAACAAKEFVGVENICAQMEDQNRDRLLTYIRALQAGKLVLIEPYDVKDLSKAVLRGNSTDDLIIRVDELERLKAANAEFEAVQARLKAVRRQCESYANRRKEAFNYYTETSSLYSELEQSEVITVANDQSIAAGLADCVDAQDLSDVVGEYTRNAINRSQTAVRAYKGARDRAQICRYQSDVDEARNLVTLGIDVAAGVAISASRASNSYALLNGKLSSRESARKRITEFKNLQGPFEIRVAALTENIDVLNSLVGQTDALKASCESDQAAIQSDITRVSRLLPDAKGALEAEQTAIAGIAQDSQGYRSAIQPLSKGTFKHVKAGINVNLSSATTALAKCDSVNSREAEMTAVQTAVRAVDDVVIWAPEIAELTAKCQKRLDKDDNDKDGDKRGDKDTGGGNGEDTDGGSDVDTGGDTGEDPEEGQDPQEEEHEGEDEGEKGDDRDSGYQGYDDDRGNLDEERVAENGIDTDAAEEAGRPDDDDGRGQNEAGEGDFMDPTYREDLIAAAERDREDAETAERIAAREGDRDRDRGRGSNGDGNDIEGEFGDAPDTDKLPDPNRDDPKDDKRDDPRPNGDDTPRNVPDTEVPTTPPAIPPVTPPGTKPGAEPEPKPGTKPGQTTPPKPEYDEAQCKKMAQGLTKHVNAMNQKLAAFQRAVAADNDPVAQTVGCALTDETTAIMTIVADMKQAKCPIEGDINQLSASAYSTQLAVNKALPRKCGAQPVVGRYEGKWTSSGTCPQVGNAGKRWVIDLSHRDKRVSGKIYFHACPGGGRLEYAVSGDDEGGTGITLGGSLVSSRGPLSQTAGKRVTFTISRNRPPSPNFAP